MGRQTAAYRAAILSRSGLVTGLRSLAKKAPESWSNIRLSVDLEQLRHQASSQLGPNSYAAILLRRLKLDAKSADVTKALEIGQTLHSLADHLTQEIA